MQIPKKHAKRLLEWREEDWPTGNKRSRVSTLEADSPTIIDVGCFNPVCAQGEPTPVGETGWGLTRVEVDAGVHRMSGSQPFGVLVYGFGSYTSYAVPGGLDLRSIAPPI